jgi:hypothetical protein
MEDCNYGPKNQLFRPLKEWPERIIRDLDWFRSKEADLISKAHSGAHTSLFFRFAKGLVSGNSWAATDGRRATFYTYATQLVIDRTAGVVLLDATANIDGRSKVVPWRVEIETPQTSYENLDIVVIPRHTKTVLSKFFKSLPNRRSYTVWMKEAILKHTNVGDNVLLVCRLALFENMNVPWWSTNDERFKSTDNYTKEFQWKWEGRNLSAIHYGIGIGSNDWKEANVVFLFDDFVLPKAAAICTTQGLKAQRADQGDLGSMQTLSSKRAGVTSIIDGNVLRQISQLASRGNLRNYDERGVCGKMRLVIACDKKRFLSNVQTLFPGVRTGHIRVVGDVDDHNTMQAKVLDLLSTTQGDILSTKEISGRLGKEWRSIVHYVNTPAFKSTEAIGWKYKNPKGCKGAYFERLPLNATERVLNIGEGVLSAVM